MMKISNLLLLVMATTILASCQSIPPTSSRTSGKGSSVTISPSAKVVRTINTSADVITSANLAQALQEVDAIVIGSPTQPLNARTPSATYFSPEITGTDRREYVNDEWITSNFRIEQVLFTKPNNPLGLQPNQNKQLTEMVGLRNEGGGLLRVTTERCFDMKQNARYVIFISRHEDSTLWVDNFNVGRFNIDGTDPEDEIGGGFLNGSRTTKQRFREELMAPPYNVVFQTLPQTAITGTENFDAYAPSLPGQPPIPPIPMTRVKISLSDTPPSDTTIVLEKQDANGVWVLLKEDTYYNHPVEGFRMEVDRLADDTSLRARSKTTDKTGNYSTSFLHPAPTQP